MNMRIRNAILFLGCMFFLTGCAERVSEDEIMTDTEQSRVNETEQAEEDGDRILLKLATTKLEDSDAYQALEMFKETVETRTGGTVEIILYPNEQLGDQTVIAQALELGTVEMGFIPIESTEEIFPQIAVLPMLFMIDDEEQVLRNLNGEFGTRILSQLREETGIVCIGHYLEGMRQIWTVSEINSLGQLQGQTIWVPQLPLYTTVFQALGASVTFMPFSQVYDGLRTRVITGVEADPETFLDYELYEVCKYCLRTNHSVTIYSFMIQDQILEKMTEEQQEVICNAAEEASQWLSAQYSESLEGVYKELEEKGVTISAPEDKNDPDMVARIEETLMEYLSDYITWEELEELREY